MRSINARIVAAASAVLAVFIAATGLALERAFHDSARSARQERLLGQVYLLIAAAEVDAQGHVTMPATLSEARFGLPGSGLYGTITDGAGKPLWRSSSALGIELPPALAAGAGEQRFGQLGGGSGRAYFVSSLGVNWAAGSGHFPFTFSVTEDLAAFNAQLRLYRESLWGWLGGMALLLLAVQALVLRWSLRPLRRVARELSAIEAGRQQRVEGRYPREITRLTDNLNALLRRERAQQQRYRDALADLAHSLKTPLAVMRGALAGEAQALPTTVDEQVLRMDRIVAYQLQRAATAGRPGALAAPIPVRPVVERIIASLDKVYRDKRVTATAAVAAEIRFHGDEGDLTELLGNLIDNAYKWCAHDVRIGAQVREGRLAITVEDDGPGIEGAQARLILERGVRADQAVPGHGIGLAVVRDIVRSYEGEITIGASTLGGAALTLDLPER